MYLTVSKTPALYPIVVRVNERSYMEGTGVKRGTEALLGKIRGGSLPMGPTGTGSEALTKPAEQIGRQRRQFAVFHTGPAAVAASFTPESPTAA